MEIIEEIGKIEQPEPSVLTVGTFDGFHRGHQSLLNRMQSIRTSEKMLSTIVTFDPHPRKVLTGQAVPILTTRQEKLNIFEENQIDRVVVLEFTKAFAEQTSREFVRSYLVEKLGVRHMVIGYDHHFGHNREGGFENLQRLGNEFGFNAEQVEPFQQDGVIVSSSMIRQLLDKGAVDQAEKLLGRHYRLFARVIHGDGRGKSIGFPTANLEPDEPDKLIPAQGVYAVDVCYKNQTYKGMMNIGVRPTFEYDHLTLEVHLFNFRGLIYGETLEIRFKKYIRSEKKFDTMDDLKKQLEIDKNICVNM